MATAKVKRKPPVKRTVVAPSVTLQDICNQGNCWWGVCEALRIPHSSDPYKQVRLTKSLITRMLSYSEFRTAGTLAKLSESQMMKQLVSDLFGVSDDAHRRRMLTAVAVHCVALISMNQSKLRA